MTTTTLLEKAVNFVYGALIFLIHMGVLFGVYQIFWAEKATIAKQNFDSVFAELKLLEPNTQLEVVIRPYDKEYALFLYPKDSVLEGCHKKTCLCLSEEDKGLDCEVLPGVDVETRSSVHISAGVSRPVIVSNLNNKLSIK